MLTLGIPSNAVMALMIGALMLHDIAPGPQVMTNNPSLFWGLIVSMWIGNVFLVILNIPLIGEASARTVSAALSGDPRFLRDRRLFDQQQSL